MHITDLLPRPFTGSPGAPQAVTQYATYYTGSALKKWIAPSGTATSFDGVEWEDVVNAANLFEIVGPPENGNILIGYPFPNSGITSTNEGNLILGRAGNYIRDTAGYCALINCLECEITGATVDSTITNSISCFIVNAGGGGNHIFGSNNCTIPENCERVTLQGCLNFTPPDGVSGKTYINNIEVGAALTVRNSAGTDLPLIKKLRLPAATTYNGEEATLPEPGEGGGGTGAFADLTGLPSDNTALAAALNAKAAADVHSVLPYAASLTLDFAADNVRTVSLTGNLAITATSNRAATRQKVVRLIADASARTLSFPAGWVWLGSAAPTSLAAGKVGVLSLYCFGSNETDVVASYSAQL